MKLSNEELGKVVFRSRHEPRRNVKRYLKDLGGTGSADELDKVLRMAMKNPDVVAIADRLDRQREITASTVEAGVDGGVAEMIADVRVRMEERQMTQSDLGHACGWQQSLVSDYMTGKKEPGARNLAKMATAVGCAWRLRPND